MQMYRSAFSSPQRRTGNNATNSPIRSNTGSPMRGIDIDWFNGGQCHFPEMIPHQLHFNEAVARPNFSFQTPRRHNNVLMPSSASDTMIDRSYHRRTSPTSVVEFERVNAPVPAAAATERKMAALYHYGHDFTHPEVSSPMARRSIHQEHGEHMPSYGKADADGNYPTPQNLRDNPERQAKVKTELCQFWIDGKECPWGINCNFAHGEHELKFRYSTLLLMEGSGQIANVYTYLCRPCPTFVSTGACPFGRRCTGIHDPRVQGPIEYPSWLPMATSKTNAQIIVDPLAAHRESATHQENPLINPSVWQHCRPSLKQAKVSNDGSETEFEDTYKLVCNTNVPIFLGNNERRHCQSDQSLPEKLTELQKLCIVEHFRKHQDRKFLYSPTSSMRGELCMILQTRYFRLNHISDDNVSKEGIVHEISYEEYKARITPWSQKGFPYSPFKVVCGHEVAFAPKGDTNCNFSIWFDEEPVRLEQTQIKRSRRIKQKNKTNLKKGHTRPNSNGALIVRTSPVDFRSGGPAINPFVYMIPAEDDVKSNRLLDDIIAHRIDSIILSMNNSDADEEEPKKLLDRKKQIQKSYEEMCSFHKKWMWPRREGLDNITYSTQAPPGNAITYAPKTTIDDHEGKFDIGNIWQGFVENMAVNDHEAAEHKKRLPVFHSLSLRSESRRTPRLSPSNEEDDGIDHTWKQLLLGQSGEWSTALELYENKMKGSAPARNLPLSTIPFVQN